jgi:CRP/FNR family cyclic AMP-dependent transcriptional regulator
MSPNTHSNEPPWKLSPEEIAKFQEAGHPRTYHATTRRPAAIFIAGDPPIHVILVLEGRVRITKSPDADGPQVLLGTRGEGELVGEIAAIDRQPRSAMVWTSGGPVRGVGMYADEFERFLKDNSEIMWRLLVAQVRAVRDADARLAASRTPAESRVIWCLKHECAKELEARPNRRVGEPVTVPLSRSDLAELAMVSDGVVSRALQSLCKAEIIKRANGRYIILKPEALLQS